MNWYEEQLFRLIERSNSKEHGISIAVPLTEYVEKICQKSTIIPYFVNGNLKGMISYYNNDPNGVCAFLTLILIAEDYQGKGLGNILLQMSINDVINKGFANYGLEVLKSNLNAVKFYEDFGFQIEEDRGEKWLMMKRLQETNNIRIK